MNTGKPFEGIKLETSVLCKHKKIAGRVESVFCEAGPIRLNEITLLKRLGPGNCTICAHRSNCSCLWEKDSNSKMSNEDLRNNALACCSHTRCTHNEDSMLHKLQRRHFYCGNLQSKHMQVIKKPVPIMYFTESEESNNVEMPSSVVEKKSLGLSISNSSKHLDPYKNGSCKKNFLEKNHKLSQTIMTKIGQSLRFNMSGNSLSAKSKNSSHMKTELVVLPKKTDTNVCDYRENHRVLVVDNKSCSKQKICSTSTLPSTGNTSHYLDHKKSFFQESYNLNSKRTEAFLEFIDDSVRRSPARTIKSLEAMQYAPKGIVMKNRFIKPIVEEENNPISKKIDDDTTISTKTNNKSSKILSLYSTEGVERNNKLVNWNKETLSNLTIQMGRSDSKSLKKSPQKKRIEKVKSATKTGKKKLTKESVKTQGTTTTMTTMTTSKNFNVKGKKNNLDLNAANESGIIPSKTELSVVPKKTRATFEGARPAHAEEDFNSKMKFSQKNCIENMQGKYTKNSFLSIHEFKISPKVAQEFHFIKSKDSGIGSEQVLSKTESKKIKGSGSVSSKIAVAKITKKRKLKHS